MAVILESQSRERSRLVIERIPHRAPWSLVDRVVTIEPARVVAEKRVSAGDPLLGEGLGGLLVMEALAQAAACLMGWQADRARLGYLVAAQGWKFHGIAPPGETVTLEAVLTAELGALHRFDGSARVGEREIASGSMTFSVA